MLRNFLYFYFIFCFRFFFFNWHTTTDNYHSFRHDMSVTLYKKYFLFHNFYNFITQKKTLHTYISFVLMITFFIQNIFLLQLFYDNKLSTYTLLQNTYIMYEMMMITWCRGSPKKIYYYYNFLFEKKNKKREKKMRFNFETGRKKNKYCRCYIWCLWEPTSSCFFEYTFFSPLSFQIIIYACFSDFFYKLCVNKCTQNYWL